MIFLELSRKHSLSLFSMNLFIFEPAMELSLVGTPDQIVSKMQDLSSMGVDGILLSWLDYIDEAHYWIENVLPRLERMIA